MFIKYIYFIKKYISKKILGIGITAVSLIGFTTFFNGSSNNILFEDNHNNNQNGYYYMQYNEQESYEIPLYEDIILAETALGRINITPLSTSNLGVARYSYFLVSSNVTELTEQYLLTYLSVTNNKSFQVEPIENGDFLLSFYEDLTPGAIYNVVYSPVGFQSTSHAFQTADVLRISGTLPNNSSHGVPIDTGIEITFTQPLANEEDFQNSFRIDPFVEGHFISRNNTYIFVPDRLNFNTLYTVTIEQGLESESGEFLQEDFIFSFNTQWGTATGPLFSIEGSVYETFLPWTEIFVDINVSRDFDNRDFYVRLYDLQTPENFLNFYRSGELIDTFELELATFPAMHREFHYLFLGRTLPEGYYLVTVRSDYENNGIVLYKFIQVSALSVYSLSVAGETVFWIHDATTHEPAIGATINVEGHVTTTDSQGVAILETTQNSGVLITIEYSSYLPFVYTKRTFSSVNLTPSGRFLTYMYTDRPTYRPNDTIDIFGIIMPRYGQAHNENDVFTLRFGNMFELPISLDSHNTFTIRVPIENMFGQLEILVEVNGERLMSSWVSFSDYTNFSFVIEGSVDRNAYFSQEYAYVELNVTNFAGTPIDSLDLIGNGQTITTDSEGIARGRFAIVRGVEGWRPFISSFSFSVSSDANMSQNMSIPFIFAPRDIMLEAERQGNDIFSFSSYNIVLDIINSANSLDGLLDDLDNFRGTPVDIDFIIEITRHVTTRTIRNQIYDHINRRTITQYNFNTDRYIYQTIQSRTQNGQAVVSGLPFSNNPLINYTMVVRYTDSRGLETIVPLNNFHGASQYFMTSESSIRHFWFELENREPPTSVWSWIPPRDLGVNQSTNIILREDSEPHSLWSIFYGRGDTSVTPTEGRILAIMFRDSVLQTTVGSPTGTLITFPEAAISNALVFGAYFYRGYIFPIPHPVTVHYDYMERELQIDFEFDQPSYRPGDEVIMTIRTLDYYGNGVPAQLTISVVDESAIQSWDGHNANLLSRLYRSSPINFWGFQYEQFSSHIQHNFGGGGSGAEGGGNGGGMPDITFRDWFIDNPIFEVVQTNSEGTASFTFVLPDQITSWRITALGTAGSGLAGDGIYNIISTLPFSVDLVLTNEYIFGDDIVASARVLTDSSIVREPIEFLFEVLQSGEVIFSDSQTTIGRGFFNAGKLEVGSYLMRVSATMGNQSDGIELPFSVEETGMIIPIRITSQISEDEQIEQKNFSMRPLPVHLILTNGNIQLISNIMRNVVDSGSFRTDVLAATAFVNNFHSQSFENGDFATDVRSLIHSRSGGIGELVYEDPDFSYTARFAASFPEFVTRDNIIRYIENEISGNVGIQTRSIALLALAAVGEPVLVQIQEEIDIVLTLVGHGNVNHEITVLYLAAALISLGDDFAAYKLMRNFDLSDIDNFTNFQREQINALKLFINTTINPQAAWDYLVSDNIPIYVSDIPERINFIRRSLFLGENISQVQFYLNGETNILTLENFDRKDLHITAEQFENLNLTPIRGVTALSVDFYGYNNQNWNQDSNLINIQRRIERYGQLYRISIQIIIPVGYYGSFTIYDRLPSNLRHVSIRQTQPISNWFNVRNTQRQLMEINFHQRPNQNRSRTFTYYAMSLFEGDMSNDITYILSRNHHIWGSTQ